MMNESIAQTLLNSSWAFPSSKSIWTLKTRTEPPLKVFATRGTLAHANGGIVLLNRSLVNYW